MYKYTNVHLDYLDLVNLRSLVERRIEECEKNLDIVNPDSIPNMMIHEMVEAYQITLNRLNVGIADIKRNKETARG